MFTDVTLWLGITPFHATGNIFAFQKASLYLYGLWTCKVDNLSPTKILFVFWQGCLGSV